MAEAKKSTFLSSLVGRLKALFPSKAPKKEARPSPKKGVFETGFAPSEPNAPTAKTAPSSESAPFSKLSLTIQKESTKPMPEKSGEEASQKEGSIPEKKGAMPERSIRSKPESALETVLPRLSEPFETPTGNAPSQSAEGKAPEPQKRDELGHWTRFLKREIQKKEGPQKKKPFEFLHRHRKKKEAEKTAEAREEQAEKIPTPIPSKGTKPQKKEKQAKKIPRRAPAKAVLPKEKKHPKKVVSKTIRTKKITAPKVRALKKTVQLEKKAATSPIITRREIIQREIIEEIRRRQVAEQEDEKPKTEPKMPKPVAKPDAKEKKTISPKAVPKEKKSWQKKVDGAAQKKILERVQKQQTRMQEVETREIEELEEEKGPKAAAVPEAAPPKKTGTRERAEAPPKIRKAESEELKRLIEKKSAGKISREQLKQLQSSIEELLEKKMLSKAEVEQNIRSIDADQVLEGFTKLIGLIQPVSSQPPMRPLSEEAPTVSEKLELPVMGGGEKPKKLVGTEKELEKKELITDFDKILEVVREKGSIRLDSLANELHISQKSAKEAVDILEDSNLVILEYSAFGPPHVVDLEYSKTRKKVKTNDQSV